MATQINISISLRTGKRNMCISSLPQIQLPTKCDRTPSLAANQSKDFNVSVTTEAVRKLLQRDRHIFVNYQLF